MSLLEVSTVSAGYQTLPVLFEVEINVAQGEIVAVLGSNGAGKTTLLRAISGLIPLRSGQVRFDGHDLSAKPEYRRVRDGLGHVPEGRRVFGSLTVHENLLIAGRQSSSVKQEVKGRIEAAFGFFPRLEERKDQVSQTLSGGEQQMLAIARGLMTDPKLLMIDEASLGLAPAMVDQLFDVIREIHSQGTSLLIVEQNARVSLEIANRAYVLENGRVVFSGMAKDLLGDRRIVELYLGGAISDPAAPSSN